MLPPGLFDFLAGGLGGAFAVSCGEDDDDDLDFLLLFLALVLLLFLGPPRSGALLPPVACFPLRLDCLAKKRGHCCCPLSRVPQSRRKYSSCRHLDLECKGVVKLDESRGRRIRRYPKKRADPLRKVAALFSELD